MLPLLLLCAAPSPALLAELDRAAGTTIAIWQHRPTSALFSRLENEGRPVWADDSVAPAGEPELVFAELLGRMAGQCPAGEPCNEFRREELKRQASSAATLAVSVPLFEIELTEGVTIGEYDFKRGTFPVNLSLRICNQAAEPVCLVRRGADLRKPELFTGSFDVPISDRAEAEAVARWRDDPNTPKRARVMVKLTGKLTGGRVEAVVLGVRVFGHRLIIEGDAKRYDVWMLVDHFPAKR